MRGHDNGWLMYTRPLYLFVRFSGFSDKDLDDVRGIFTDTNLYLLGLTFAISALHVSTSELHTASEDLPSGTWIAAHIEQSHVQKTSTFDIAFDTRALVREGFSFSLSRNGVARQIARIMLHVWTTV